MAVASVARYTGSALDLMLAVVFLGIAALHAVTDVPTAVLPAIGSLALLGAAIGLAPVTRRQFRQDVTGRDDVVIFLGTLTVAALSLRAVIALGRFF